MPWDSGCSDSLKFAHCRGPGKGSDACKCINTGPDNKLDTALNDRNKNSAGQGNHSCWSRACRD
eukprot:4055050-Pleurochrysis_carterae.AAC.1